MKRISLILTTLVLLLTFSNNAYAGKKLTDEEFYAIWCEIDINENEYFDFGENDYFTIEYYYRVKGKDSEIITSNVNARELIEGDVRIHDKLEDPRLFVKDITFHGSCESIVEAGYAIERQSYGDYICLCIVCGMQLDTIMTTDAWIIKDSHHDENGYPLTTDELQSMGKLETVAEDETYIKPTKATEEDKETKEDEAFSPSQANIGATMDIDDLIETYTEPANELAENSKKLGIGAIIAVLLIIIVVIVILYLSKFTNLFPKKEDDE